MRTVYNIESHLCIYPKKCTFMCLYSKKLVVIDCATSGYKYSIGNKLDQHNYIRFFKIYL